MIVNEILLENWGVFRDQRKVNLSESLNLLIGPNESGKSTIADALRLVFFDKHTARSGKVEQLVPWGSDLSPKASVIFETQGKRFKITKRFLRNATSILGKEVSGKWQRISEGDAADRDVVELTGGKLASHGESRPEHWGLAQVLWARQGETFPEGGVNEDVKTRIQSTFGVIIVTQEEAKIRESIKERFTEVLTPSRREFRAGSELDITRAKIQQLEERKVQLEQKLRDREKLMREITDAKVDLSEKRDSFSEAEEALDKALKDAKKASEHEKDRIGIDADVKILEEKHSRLNERVDKVKLLGKNLEGGERQTRTKKKQIQEEKQELKRVVAELKTKKGKLKGLKRDLLYKQGELTIARQVWGTLRDQADLQELGTRLQKAVDLEEEKERFETQLELLKAPTEGEIAELRKLQANVDRRRTQLEAIGLTAQLTAEDKIKGTILLDDAKEEFKLRANSFEEWKAAQKITLKLPNLVEFEVRSGSEDVQKLREELEKLRQEYSDKVAAYETSDLNDLEARSKERSNLETQIGGLEKRLSDVSPEGVKKLKQQVKIAKQRIESNWSKIPFDSRFLEYKRHPDIEKARAELVSIIESLEEENQGLEEKERRLASEIETLGSGEAAHRQSIAELDSSVQLLRGGLRQMSKELQELRGDGLTDEERREKLQELGYELDRKHKTLERLEKEKEEMEDKPKRKSEEAQQRCDHLQEMVNMAGNNLSNLEGQLQEQAKEATYSDLAVIEEELQDLTERCENLTIYVQAVELLYDLYEWHKKKTIESVMEPLTRIVSDNLQRLIGPRYGLVRLDEDFFPASVEVPDWGIEVELEPLSYGTKEQLAVLVRLALGEVLAKEEKQLVILDDPLTNTHVSRLRPALEILREASKRLQLMVLTCHSSQYSALASMNVIEM